MTSTTTAAATPPPFVHTGWAVAGFDTNTSPPAEAIMEEQTHSGASTPTASAGAAPPPQLVAAFLQAQTAAAPATRHVVLRSSASVNSDDGDVLLLHNPFAAASTEQQQQQCCPSMPALASSHQPAAPASTTATRKQRTLLQRLVRGLMVTAASAGLVALGAWGGSAAYKHYMAQLDDRDKLAQRVAELSRVEDKLVLRCTALEQERSSLGSQLKASAAALADGEAARRALAQQLREAAGERDEAVRLNLGLQRKLGVAEETQASLAEVHKEAVAALEGARGEASRLGREVGKLSGMVERLQARCGALDAHAAALKQENEALSHAAAGERFPAVSRQKQL